MRIFRVVTHLAEKQHGCNIRRRAARGRMSAARRRCRGDGMDAELVGDALQKFCISVNHEARSLREKSRKPRMKIVRDVNVTAARGRELNTSAERQSRQLYKCRRRDIREYFRRRPV